MICLHSNPRSSPIGAIARDLERNLGLQVPHQPRDDERTEIRRVYEDADAVFGHRLDYRLWRTATRPYFSYKNVLLSGITTGLSESWGAWREIAAAALTSPDPLVVWGLVAIAPAIMHAALANHDIQTGPAVLRLADQLEMRLRDLEPLAACPASCGIAAVYFLRQRQHLRFRCDTPLDVSDCDELFKQIREWLRFVDPNWEPGLKLDMKEVSREGDLDRLRPAHPANEFTLLVRMLATLRPIISNKIHALDARAERLLGDAYRFSLTAWLTARSRRIQERQFQAARGQLNTVKGRLLIQRAFEVEFACHLQVSAAARDAGEYLESAKQLYLLFRLIPDEFKSLLVVERELKRRGGVIRYLKEAGLEVDARFVVNDSLPEIQESIKRGAERRAAMWRGSTEPLASTGSSESRPAQADSETGFALRVRSDQAVMPEWKILLAEIRPGLMETPPCHLLTLMRGLADDHLPASARALIAGFKVALHYGYVRSAGKILARSIHEDEFDLTPDLLLDFVHAVRRCLQLDPFGVRHERWEDWQKLIKAACAILFDRFGSEWMPGPKRLWIHETLINQTHVHHKSLSAKSAQRLFEKSSGAYDIKDLREFYDLDYNFNGRAASVANRVRIANRLMECTESPLGPPVAVSLLMIGGVLSILAIGAGGTIYTDQCAEPTLAEDVDALLQEGEYWFKMQGTATNREISWPGSLRRIGQAIIAVASRCDSSARVLLLSMDTALAQLPWQHLLNLDGELHERLVSIIPSLSAFCLNSRRSEPMNADSRTLLSTEPGNEVVNLVQAVMESTRVLDLTQSGICIVAGHGLPPKAGELPAVRIGTDDVIETLDQWLDVAGSRVTILHCCHSGMPRPLFMEEFGGIAGLAICLGTKTVLAPVAEVHSSTAIALQRRLFADPTRTIGVGYLDAIEVNASCCLYTLYGNPYERLASVQPRRSIEPAMSSQDSGSRIALMNRYYLNISSTIERYYPGGAPPDWATRVFDDATNHGTGLRMLGLPRNWLGPRLAVFGEQFYFEFGRDRRRSDTFYLMRIERAKLSTTSPRVLECQIHPWPGGSPEQLDNTADLFEEASNAWTENMGSAAMPRAEISISDMPVAPDQLSPEDMLLVENWVLRLRGLDRGRLRAEEDQIRERISECYSGLDSVGSLQQFSASLDRVARLRIELANWMTRFPSVEILLRDRNEAATALAAARAVLGDDVAAFVASARNMTPTDLNEITELLAKVEILAGLPRWIWNIGSGMATPPSTLFTVAEALVRVECRQAVQQIVGHLAELGEPAAAEWLAPVPASCDLNDHIQEWFQVSRAFLLEVIPEVQRLVRANVQKADDLSALVTNAALLTELRDAGGDAFVIDVIKHVSGQAAADISMELAAIRQAVAFFNEQVGGLDEIGFGAVLRRAALDRVSAKADRGDGMTPVIESA